MENRELSYADKLSAMVRKATVSYYGQEDKTVFREFHSLLRELFPNIFAVCEFEDFDGSFLMRWKGRNSEALPVMFMNHHDVVEAHGEWKHYAFSGGISDGRVWGRGTLDTKGGLFGMLMAADELAAEGFIPETDIYFESGCNEETDGAGADMISRELERRKIRFSFVLDEGGFIMYEPIGGAKANFAMVGVGEKGCAELRFIARGQGGHSSTPEKDSPLVRLGKFMADVDKGGIFDVSLSKPVREMLCRMAPSIKGPIGHIFAHPKVFKGVLEKVMPNVSATANALIQTTAAFTMAQGSEGRNVIPAEASVTASMRVSPHQGYEKSLAAIAERAKKYGIETEVLEPAMDSGIADFASSGFRLIEAAVSNSFTDVTSVPYIMTGASDARFMSRVSDNCFRFVPFIIDEQQLESIHGLDENVYTSTLIPAVEFYKYIMKEVR